MLNASSIQGYLNDRVSVKDVNHGPQAVNPDYSSGIVMKGISTRESRVDPEASDVERPTWNGPSWNRIITACPVFRE